MLNFKCGLFDEEVFDDRFHGKKVNFRPKVERKSPREAKKSKESKENGHKAKSPNQPSPRGRTLCMACPRPPFLMRKLSFGGAAARPRWRACATPFHNDQDSDNRVMHENHYRYIFLIQVEKLIKEAFGARNRVLEQKSQAWHPKSRHGQAHSKHPEPVPRRQKLNSRRGNTQVQQPSPVFTKTHA
ncbi:hypothetical protein PIB30_084870 [Stylosanthes scabra]|uniref:Uncharacterized protein n=1 Tax=Stylosanthes scabra TaxID=79078 RepID=A0ABU6UTU1_9FABA|nr:hypothetical protein [Stylosanthes scabra]